MPFGFAEGFHWEALVTGSASILLAWGLLRNSWTGSAGQRYVGWLSRVARRMGLNPKDVCREAVKFDLVRIVFGVLVFFRYVPQLLQAWATDNGLTYPVLADVDGDVVGRVAPGDYTLPFQVLIGPGAEVLVLEVLPEEAYLEAHLPF